MCVDCVLASPRIAQVDPGDEPLFEVVLPQAAAAGRPRSYPKRCLLAGVARSHPSTDQRLRLRDLIPFRLI
jgi:hypothetical protein